jgi:hypothetical protein
LVVVLSPPNRPPNIARVDVVAAGLRALAWWTSMDDMVVSEKRKRDEG